MLVGLDVMKRKLLWDIAFVVIVLIVVTLFFYGYRK